MKVEQGIRVGNRLRDNEPVTIHDVWLREHALVFGSSGKGKTFFSYVLIREQLAKGCSLVALDPKRRTIRRLRALCEEMNLPAHRVKTIDGAEPMSAPGFNPFRSAAHPADAAASILTMLEKAKAFEGAIRVKGFMKAAVPVAAWHGLPLSSVPQLLREPEFLNRVLSTPTVRTPSPAYREAVAYLRSDFADYKESDRKDTLRAIRLRLGFLTDNDLFIRIFRAEEDGLKLDDLFTREGRGAVLLSMEEGGGVTAQSALLMAGIIADQLFAAARREPGPVPVLLVLEEIRKMSGFLEEGIRDVVNMARESNIRLLVSGQHPGQLPEQARTDLLASSSVKAYFNPGGDPTTSAEAAKAIARKEPPPLPQEMPQVPPEPMRPVRARLFASRTHREYEGLLPVELRRPVRGGRRCIERGDAEAVQERFMAGAWPCEKPLWVGNTPVKVRDVLARMPDGCRAYVRWWDGVGYLEIDPPAQLPPAPKPLPPRERWERALAGLATQQAVLDLGNETPEATRIATVTARSDASPEYVARLRAACFLPEPIVIPPATPTGAPTLSASAATAPAPTIVLADGQAGAPASTDPVPPAASSTKVPPQQVAEQVQAPQEAAANKPQEGTLAPPATAVDCILLTRHGSKQAW